MRNLLDLANDVALVAPAIEAQAHLQKIAFAKEVVFTLIRETPVDTSKALSNWRVAAEVMAEIGPHVIGAGGSSKGASAASAEAAADAALAALKPGQKVVIFNSVKYIQRLNDGYSAQAPAGFIEAAIARAERVLRA